MSIYVTYVNSYDNCHQTHNRHNPVTHGISWSTLGTVRWMAWLWCLSQISKVNHLKFTKPKTKPCKSLIILSPRVILLALFLEDATQHNHHFFISVFGTTSATSHLPNQQQKHRKPVVVICGSMFFYGKTMVKRWKTHGKTTILPAGPIPSRWTWRKITSGSRRMSPSPALKQTPRGDESTSEMNQPSLTIMNNH